MKKTAQEFITELATMGVNISVHDDTIALEGQDKEFINALYEKFDSSPELRAAIIKHLRTYTQLSCKDFLQELENTGVKLTVEFSAFELELNFTGGSDKARLRLEGILTADTMLKAKVILSQAMNKPDLTDIVKERACIRYADGYSDSLIMAALSYIAPTGEKEHKELRQKTDWIQELKTL